jgi:hypothetical protein
MTGLNVAMTGYDGRVRNLDQQHSALLRAGFVRQHESSVYSSLVILGQLLLELLQLYAMPSLHIGVNLKSECEFDDHRILDRPARR